MKKYFAIVLVLISALILLASCDGSSNTTSTGGEASTPTTQKPSQNQTATDSPQDGLGDTFDDIGDGEIYTDAPYWDGEYIDRDAGFSITITNFNSVSFFDFEIYLLGNGGEVLEGKATISPDTDYTAEYGEISFVLYYDNSAIELFAPEGSEWAHLSGDYKRIE